MILTRNRTIGDRLSTISIQNIWPLIKSVRKVLLSTGKQQIFDWLEIWNQSAIRILVCFRCWYQTRLKNKFFRGLRVMQKILLGQNIRWQIRKMLEVSLVLCVYVFDVSLFTNCVYIYVIILIILTNINIYVYICFYT